MIVIALLFVFLLVVVGAVAAGSARPTRFRRTPPRPVADPADLALDDPVEALARFGTSDDAARLAAEGRGGDLAGLGYRGDG